MDTVLRESMRLYPPVWVIGRRALAPFRLGDYELPADTNVLISQLLMHRDARYFPEPERFDPDRWSASDPRGAALPRFAYFPFGGGPRVCIGAAIRDDGSRVTSRHHRAAIPHSNRARAKSPDAAHGHAPSPNGIPVTLKRR